MTIVLGIRAIVALAGLLMMAFSANGKVVDIGRMMFFAGLLALLLVLR